MAHALQIRVEQVRAAGRRLLWWYATARFAAAVLVLGSGLCAIDYLLRLHDPLARWLLSSLAVALAGIAFVTIAWPSLRAHHSLLATARRIELRFPELGERLSSSIAFLSQGENDRTAGSPDLRRAVIAEAEALAADLDFHSALDGRATRRSGLILLAAIALVGLLALFSPSTAGLAVARLAQPWRELAWPRRHELAFENGPERLAKGEDFEVVLVDRRGLLPADAQIQIRHETSGLWRTEVKTLKPIGGRVVFRHDNVSQSFEYRAHGGDDDTMPWIEVAVVEPPKIVDLQIVVEPPAYTKLPPRSSGHVVSALVGSTLQIRGKLDQPVRSAALKANAQEMEAPAVEIGRDDRSFFAPATGSSWVVERSAKLALELTDPQGMMFGKDARIELNAVEDRLPAISWEAPGDHSFATARAVVPIKAIVKDDLRVKTVQLRYLRPGQSDEEQVVVLYERQAANLPEAGSRFQDDQQRIEFAWDLSHLAGLAAGDVLAIRLTAEDAKPQLATTTVRRVTIISEEELEHRLTIRQASILAQLSDALRLARQGREQSQSLETKLRESGEFSASDRNLLQAAQHNHRQLQRMLAQTPEGAAGQISALLNDLAANHAEQHSSTQRLRELLRQVQELNQSLLPVIEQEMTQAIKSATESTDVANLVTDTFKRLESIGTRQDEVARSLESMVGTLGQWDNFSRIAREISQVRSDQDRLASETDELKLKAAVAAAEVSPVDRAAARQLSQRQLELARRLDKLQTRMEEMLAKLTADDPLSAAALADALDAARRLAIGSRMREAAARLAQVQPGQARESQQQTQDALRQLIELLSMRRDYELARNLASLRQASSELAGLSTRGAKVRAEAARVNSQPDEARGRELERLRRELEEMAKTGQELSRRLQRLQAQRAAAAVSQAAGAAARAAGSGDATAMEEQTAETRRRLEEAQQELAGAIAQVEEELAREQLARVEQMIAGNVSRQKNVIAETQRLESRRDSDGQLEASEQAALKNLASEERVLSDETDQLRPRFAAAAFAFALESGAQSMRRAGVLLSRGQTDEAVLDAERAALTYLEQILNALKNDDAPPAVGSPKGEPNGEQQPGPGDFGGSMAEIKLLKFLQEAINARTGELESRRARQGSLTADQQQELDSLARQQGRLADMVLELIKASAQPEDEGAELFPKPK
jgi:hypothetical protein